MCVSLISDLYRCWFCCSETEQVLRIKCNFARLENSIHNRNFSEWSPGSLTNALDLHSNVKIAFQLTLLVLRIGGSRILCLGDNGAGIFIWWAKGGLSAEGVKLQLPKARSHTRLDSLGSVVSSPAGSGAVPQKPTQFWTFQAKMEYTLGSC